MTTVQCVGHEAILFNDLPTDQVLLNYSFDHFRGTTVVPRAIGVDYCYWPIRARLQAVCFGSHDRGIGTNEVKFFQSLLKVLPRFKSNVLFATLWFGLVSAKEDVSGGRR